MKSSTKSNPKTSGAQIQFAHAATELQAEPDSLRSLRIQTFRVPWGPLKPAAPSTASRLTSANSVPNDRPTAMSVPGLAAEARTDEVRTELPAPALNQSLPSFELVLEDIRRRHETKTIVLEEALQRSERFPDRFWGINE